MYLPINIITAVTSLLITISLCQREKLSGRKVAFIGMIVTTILETIAWVIHIFKINKSDNEIERDSVGGTIFMLIVIIAFRVWWIFCIRTWVKEKEKQQEEEEQAGLANNRVAPSHTTHTTTHIVNE